MGTNRAETSWLAAASPLAVLGALPPGVDVVVVRDGDRWVIGVEPDEVVERDGAGAFDALDDLAEGEGWWAACVSYDLGRSVERVTPRLPDDLGLPDLILARFDARLVLGPGGMAQVEGRGPTRSRLEAVAARAAASTTKGPLARPGLAGWVSDVSRSAFEQSVRAVIGLIEAGDCFQVNLARRLTCPTPADPVALFASLVVHNPAPHGALVQIGDRSVVSASPERFLARDGDRVETRPIKGTSTDPAALAASAKDRAENVMIVDLARNDLGRVCDYATITVPSLCAVESHPGLHHLVSTVTGRLRPGVGHGTLLRATFPPASVTGAPKPRVLQAIEDLEASRRGVYCGAIGWVDADRERMDLNVAIRTFVVAAGATHLGVGAGIVADSDPAAEWRETELKSARLLEAAG